MRLCLPKPAKKALALVERLLPSMTKSPASGKSHFFDSALMASFSEPSGSGVNLLKIGMSQRGAMYCSASMSAVVASHAQSHASGKLSKSQMSSASSGSPMSAASTSPFTASSMNVAGVVLLKPYLASMRKVSHHENGRLSSDDA